MVPSFGTDSVISLISRQSRIETLMCYLGVGDTFTPCHKDLCASSGHNLMCYTEAGGSSYWFMTESRSAPVVSRYFRRLNQELDHEAHVISLLQLAEAPFKVYVIEQQIGDLVLVPPRSAHQVVNYGGITLKTSWSRMTPKGLSVAYHHELPLYRRSAAIGLTEASLYNKFFRVCRPETYCVKSTVYFALRGRVQELDQLLKQPDTTNSCGGEASKTDNQASSSLALLARTLKELLSLYDHILQEEYLETHSDITVLADTKSPDEQRVVCDFCESDIFQTFFECPECGDGFSSCIICSGCYTEGRTCGCVIGMKPMQCRAFRILLDARVKARAVLTLQSIQPLPGKLDL